MKNNPYSQPTPLQVLERMHIKHEDKVFLSLILCGFTKISAYLTAYKSNASGNSAASMASRKLSEPQMVEAQRLLRIYFNFNKFKV